MKKCKLTLSYIDPTKSIIEWDIATDSLVRLCVSVAEAMSKNEPLIFNLANGGMAIIASTVYTGGVFYFDEAKS